MSIIQVLLGGNCQRQKIVQSAMEHAAMAAYPKEFASMTGGLRLGITMSSIINESQFINGWGGKASVYDRLGGKVSVYDRLGGRVNEKSNNQLKELANSLVLDEDIMCRAPKRQYIVQLYNEGTSQSHKKPNPQWCPNGLKADINMVVLTQKSLWLQLIWMRPMRN
jgi:hypothetical protein